MNSEKPVREMPVGISGGRMMIKAQPENVWEPEEAAGASTSQPDQEVGLGLPRTLHPVEGGEQEGLDGGFQANSSAPPK